jgi:hypothetical protein
MNRFRLRVAVAVITFVIGAGFHQGLVSLARVALRYDTVALEDPSITIPEKKFEAGNLIYERSVLVISMPDTRELYLGKKLVGTADDTRELEAELRNAFARLDQEFMNAQPSDLNEELRLSSGQRMVYLKVYPQCRFPDVIRLIEVAKQAGAQHVALIADSHKNGNGCRGRYLWNGSRFWCFRMDQI